MSKPIVVPFGMLWLKERLDELGKSGAALGRHLKIPKERVYEMYAGRRRLQPEEIGPTARFLEWTDAEIIARLENRVPLNETKKQNEKMMPQTGAIAVQLVGDPTTPALVVYRAVALGDGRGGFMLYAERIDEVPRPFFLKFSNKAFGIKILDDTNSPVYKRWDTIMIDPGGSTAEGEDHIFTSDLNPSGDKSIIGCLKSSTVTHWTVHQYGTRKDHDLPRSEYPHAWPVVGRYNRR